MSVTKIKPVNQWVIAWLVAALVGVLVLAFAWFPRFGWSKAMPLALTSLGIFLTAIALHCKKEKVVGALALACILLAVYSHLDSLMQN